MASWFDGKRFFRGGGILVYNSAGYWMVREGNIYTDIGGKYSPDDGNIYATIARELREETYGSIEFLARDIEKLEKYGINMGKNEACYKCIVISDEDFKKELGVNFVVDRNDFLERLNKVKLQNNHNPYNYKTDDINLISDPSLFSKRMKQVLKSRKKKPVK